MLIVFGVLVVFVLLLATVKPSPLEHYRWQKEAEKKLAEQEKMICDDVYGGDTPEETYNMYRDAMIKKDVDTAMLYVDLFNRDRMRKYIDGQNLDDFIKNDLPSVENMMTGKERGYYHLKYRRYVEPYTYVQDGVEKQTGGFDELFIYKLIQNRCNNKWKIVGL